MKQRILYACLIHETHTFLDTPTPLSDFAVVLDQDILRREGDGSVVDGFLTVARDVGWEVVPTVAMIAMPSGLVKDEVFERFWSEFAQRTRTALDEGIAAIFLSLHGAMVTESFHDAEGELLERIRALPGAESLPIFGSLDLHGNVSERMTVRADAFVAFAENPHTDARATSMRAARLLQRCLESGKRPHMLWRNVPLVWAPPGTGTARDPMLSLERMARKIEAEDDQVWAVNVFAGYLFADTPDTGVSFSLAMEGPDERGWRHLDALSRCAWEHRLAGNILYPPAAEVLAQILPVHDGPVVLVEPSDNIGGGAPGDGTGLLRALLHREVTDAAVIINDPESVRQVRSVRLGAMVRLEVGGRGWSGDPGPVSLEVTLLSRSDGRFTLEDPNSHFAAAFGRHIEMGECAVVRCRGITILLTSRKTPPFDLGQLRSQGIEPTRMKIIGVKAAVAHQRAYDPIARASYFVDTPGPCSSDVSAFTFTRLRRPVYPLDATARLE